MAQPKRDDGWSGIGIGWSITATLLAGILVWGGIGYLVDRLVGWEGPFVVLGIVLGAAGAIYLVYLRHGRGDDGGDG